MSVTPEPDLPSYQRFDCTDTTDDQQAATEAARRAIEDGDCIVVPTDTVYGIGADAFSPDAVQRLLDAKDRGRDMPPPVLIADSSLIRALATDLPDAAKQLVNRHWPGALTVICKIQPSLRMDLGDAEGTIALRVPDHDLVRAVLRQTGPMAVSSANLSGQPAALTCDEAVDQLGESVAVYLDGGPVRGAAQPSTIVDFTRRDEGEVLRRGAINLDVLRETLPDLIDLTADPTPDPDPSEEPDASPDSDSSPEPLEESVDPELLDPPDGPVIESPVIESPVIESPVIESPVIESPAVEGSDGDEAGVGER